MKKATTYTSLAAMSAAAIMFDAPAFAQQTTPEQINPPAAMEQPESSGGNASNTTDEVKTNAMAETTVALGQAVWSSDGEELGKVSKVNLDMNGNLESIYFVVGSVLGHGGKTVMSEAADFSQNEDRIELKIDSKAANDLPEIKS